MRCLSCRKLRVACDRAHPCEYCAATGRTCEYPLALRRHKPAAHKQLGITKFEYRLACYFHSVFVHPDIQGLTYVDRSTVITKSGRRRPVTPVELLWAYDVPALWQQSAMVRQNMYALLLTLLQKNTNTTPLMIQDLGIAVLSCREVSLAYYTGAVASTAKYLAGVVDQELSQVQAAEIVFLGLFLFIYLVFQTAEVILVLSDDPDETDLVRLIKAINLSMRRAYPVLRGTPYAAIFLQARAALEPPRELPRELRNPPRESAREFPIASELRRALARVRHRYSPTQLDRFEAVLALLDQCIHESIQGNDPDVNITRWIFLFDTAVYDMMVDRDPFSMKLLYYYCCLTLVFGIRPADPRLALRQYLWYYKDFCFARGGWSQTEQDFFLLVLLGHTCGAAELATFMPGAVDWAGRFSR